MRSEVRFDIQKVAPAVDPESGPDAALRVEEELDRLEDGLGEDPVLAVSQSGAGGSVPGLVHPDESFESIQAAPQASHAGPSGRDASLQGIKAPMKITEWVALATLGVMLVGLSVGAYFWSIRILPEKKPLWESTVFPVRGAHIEIRKADTYWRYPVLEGPDKDLIRRGTRLIPVLELEASGTDKAIRAIFRDEEGGSIGDPVIRVVPDTGKLTLASTAGFEDAGLHAAYRTGELEPWTVEIYEAESADAPGSAYSLVLKINISSELR